MKAALSKRLSKILSKRLSNDYLMTILWLSEDYPMTIQWLFDDYPMTIQWLSRTFDLFFLMIIALKRSIDRRWLFKSGATFILRWSCFTLLNPIRPGLDWIYFRVSCGLDWQIGHILKKRKGGHDDGGGWWPTQDIHTASSIQQQMSSWGVVVPSDPIMLKNVDFKFSIITVFCNSHQSILTLHSIHSTSNPSL